MAACEDGRKGDSGRENQLVRVTPALSPGVQLRIIGLLVGLRNLVVGGFVFMAFELGGCWLFFLNES